MPFGAAKLNGIGRYIASVVTSRIQATVTASTASIFNIISNGAATSKFGGASAYFPGTPNTQSLVVTNWDSSSITTAFTFECWAYFTNITTNSTAELYMHGTSSNTQDFHRVYAVFKGAEANRLYIALGVSGNAVYLYQPFTWVANTWYHIAITRDSNNDIRHFVNGTLLGSAQNSNKTWCNSATGDQFSIGRFRTGTSLVVGYIDEVRISNIARYTSSFIAPTTSFANDSNTTFLMHCDGVNGSTTFTDDLGTGIGRASSLKMDYNLNALYVSNSIFSDTKGIAFSSDGTKLYTIGDSTDTVKQYTLSTAWDITSINVTAAASFSISTQEATSTDLAFSSDGLNMYIIGTTNKTVYQYTLSSAWSLSTAAYASKSLSVSAYESAPTGLTFSSDGTKMFFCGSGRFLRQYNLSTAWDISTATYSTNSSTARGDTSWQAIAFGNSGAYLYVVGATSKYVTRFTLSTPYTANTLSASGDQFGIISDFGTPTGIYEKSDGSKVFVSGSGRVGQWTQTTAWDVGTSIPKTIFGAAYLSGLTSVGTITGFDLSSSGTRLYTTTSTTGYQFNLSTGYDLSTTTYSAKSFSFSAQETSLNAIFWKSDGTKCYIGGGTGKISQYSASTPWGINTLTYDSKQFLTTTQDSLIKDIFFSNDGTYMYMTAVANANAIYQYTLSTPWDVSTATYTRNLVISSNIDNSPNSCAFNSDGTRLYVMAISASTAFYQYNLSTGYDLSTATFIGQTPQPLSAIGTVANLVGVRLGASEGQAFLCFGNESKVCSFTMTG